MGMSTLKLEKTTGGEGLFMSLSLFQMRQKEVSQVTMAMFDDEM